MRYAHAPSQLPCELEAGGGDNQFLHHGLLEAGCPRHIEWGNRSLQEFYAGLYLVKYAGPQDVVPL